MIVVTSWSALGILLLVGHLARRYSRLLRALHLPASVVGGIVGWLFFAVCDVTGAGVIMEEWFSVGWDVLPGFCTNIVFCCLFLGTPVPSFADVLASPRREQASGVCSLLVNHATSPYFAQPPIRTKTPYACRTVCRNISLLASPLSATLEPPPIYACCVTC